MGNEPFVRIFTPSVSHNRARNVATANRLVDKVQDHLVSTFGLRDVRVQVSDDNSDFPAKKKFERYEFTVAVFVDFEICLGTCEVADDKVGEAAAFIMTIWHQQQDYSTAMQSSLDDSITESDECEAKFSEDFFSQLSRFAADLRSQEDQADGC